MFSKISLLLYIIHSQSACFAAIAEAVVGEQAQLTAIFAGLTTLASIDSIDKFLARKFLERANDQLSAPLKQHPYST